MNILITGGAGFIGANFVYHMLDAHPDYKLIVLDKLTYAGNLETLEPVMDMITFVKGDIADRTAVYELFETHKPDIVVNFAAESHVDRASMIRFIASIPTRIAPEVSSVIGIAIPNFSRS